MPDPAHGREGAHPLDGTGSLRDAGPVAGHDALRGLDRARVRRHFDRAAAGFDAAAVLHAEIRESLLARLDYMSLDPKVVIDAGAGTGHASRNLTRRYPKALVIALDTSMRMLQRAERQNGWIRRFAKIQGDAQCLPLASRRADLILSNLLLPWCDLDTTLGEWGRALSPGGLVSFSTLGPDTLRELRSAWAEADEPARADEAARQSVHVHDFIDMHDVGDALVRHGFQAPVLDVERYTLNYPDVRRVAEDLRATGGLNASTSRPRGLTGRRRLAALETAYEKFRRDGRLPATYEVVFAHAWAAPADAARAGGRGTRGDSAVSLEDLKRELRSRRTS